MSNHLLSNSELDNIYKLYEHFGAEKLDEFLRTIWMEAYNLGHTDGSRTGEMLGYTRGWNERMIKEPERPVVRSRWEGHTRKS